MTPETQELPVLLRDIGEVTTAKLPLVIPIPSKPAIQQRRPFWPTITTTAVAVVCLGTAVGLPMIKSLHSGDRLAMPPVPPGSTQTHEPPPSDPPTILPSQNPVEQPQIKATLPLIPTPIPSLSVCETQEGTVEGQLPDGEPVVPATMDRPSIIVVSPDRSSNQSLTVRHAGDPDEAWNDVNEPKDVGIVVILTADTEVKTTDKQSGWAKSCAPTSLAAVEEVDSRVNDLCSRSEFGLRAVVVYHVGADGRPVFMNSTDC